MMRATLLFILQVVVLCLAADHYCSSTSPDYTPYPGFKLELVQTVTRHGARTPIYLVPAIEQPLLEWNCELHELVKPSFDAASSFDNTRRLFRKVYRSGVETLKGNCSFGQLTDVGYRQHAQLGQRFRRIYGESGHNLFGGRPKMSQIRVRSTDVYRTLQSAQASINGMFSSSNYHGIAVETLTLETTDNTMDDMTPNGLICPPLIPAQAKVIASQKWIDQTEKVRPLADHIKKVFNVDTLPPWDGLYDIYQLRRCRGEDLPADITEDVFRQIRLAAEWEWNTTYTDPDVARYGMGTFLRLLRDNVVDYISHNKTDIKYRLYSGHDSTIAPLLGLLELYDSQWPPFASYINLELFSKGGEYFIQIKYNGKEMKLPVCDQSMCEAKRVLAFFDKKVVTPADCGLTTVNVLRRG